MAVDQNVCCALGLDPALLSSETIRTLEYFSGIAEKRIRLKAGIGDTDAIPDALSWIVSEYTIQRYNRVGSEGYKAHTVEGETISFADDDFSAFDDAIINWLEAQKGHTKGKVRFL